MPLLQSDTPPSEKNRRAQNRVPEMRQGIYRKGKKMRRISFKRFLGIHSAALAAVVLYLLSPIKCPIKYFFHFDCPTCGMTRAMLSLVKGDIAAYFDFNPAALPFVLVVLFALHKNLFPLSGRVKNWIIIGGAVCVFITYILRIIFK